MFSLLPLTEKNHFEAKFRHMHTEKCMDVIKHTVYTTPISLTTYATSLCRLTKTEKIWGKHVLHTLGFPCSSA